MGKFKEFLLNEKTDKEIYLEIDKRYKELKKKDIEDLKALGNRLSKVNSAKTKAEFISLILDAEFGSKQWAAHDRYEDSINEANNDKIISVKGDYKFQGKHDSQPKVTEKNVQFKIDVSLTGTGKFKSFTISEPGVSKMTYQNKPFDGKKVDLPKLLRTGTIETFDLPSNDYNEKNNPDAIGTYYISFNPSDLEELKQYV